MYNLDVCQIHDLGAVPNSIQGPWPNSQYPGWPSQTLPCSCFSKDANSTIGGQTLYFRDQADADITTVLSAAINTTQVVGSEDTCYVTNRGNNYCYMHPGYCLPQWPPP